jgi:hypothetical protein
MTDSPTNLEEETQLRSFTALQYFNAFRDRTLCLESDTDAQLHSVVVDDAQVSQLIT